MAEYKIQSISMTITLTDSTVLNIGDSDIMLGSLSVDEASSGATAFEIGTAIAKKLSFQIRNYNGEYNAYDFTDATINASIVAAVTNGGTTTTENIPLGVFFAVDKPNYNGGVITFSAIDGLYKTARDYTTALTFPANLLQIYNELCTNCGLVPEQATIPNANYLVVTKPNLDATTAADMLCYIAQISGTFAQMNSRGRLELKTYGGTSHTLTDSYSMEVDTDDVVITGVKVTECFDETDTNKRQTALYGTAAYALTIEENPLIGYGKAYTVADFLASVYVGMQFRPLRIVIPKNPTIHVGDSITFTDYKGNTYTTYATEVSFNTNENTTVAMNAASPERNSAVRYSAEAKALAESKRLVDNEKTARELAIEAIEQQIAGAGGMYETTVAQPGGGSIYYLHNKPTLAESTTILRIDDTGIYISNDGGQTYPLGLDYSGTEILNKIYAIGIDADYITTGSITSAQSGFGFDLDNGTGNIGGWEISSNALGKTATVTYPANYFTAADVTAAANAASRNCTADEYKYALLHYDLNMDGRISAQDTSSISTNASGTAISYTRTIEMSPYGVVPYTITSDYMDRPYTFISAGSVTFGDSSGSATIYNSGSALFFSDSATRSGLFSIQHGSITYQHATAYEEMTLSAGRVPGLNTAESVHYSNGIVFTSSGGSTSSSPYDQGWIRFIGVTESDSVLEIATGDDGGAGEQIVVRQYNSSNAVAREVVLLNKSGNTTFPGSVSANSGLTAPNGSITAGTSGDTTATRRVTAQAGAGTIYIYSQASATGIRGLYGLNASGTGVSIISVDSSNSVTFYGSLNGNASTATLATTATLLSPTGDGAFTTDANGNFTHKRTTATDYWHLNNNAGTAVFSVYWETGVVNVASGGDYRVNSASIVPIKGGNASSGYIRFPNIKIQIAWKKVTWTGAITTAWGSSYESTAVISLGNWSTAFSEEPRVAMGATTSAGTAGVAIEFYGKPTSSAAGSVYLFRPTSMTSQTWWVYVIGIGAYS